jgi:hypothetical protein
VDDVTTIPTPPVTGGDRPWWRRVAEPALGLDLRSMALFRIAIAAILLVDLLIRAGALSAHYTEFANPWHWSVHFGAANAWQVGFLFLVNAAVAVMLLVGWRTRLATILCWGLLVSLHNRNNMVLNAGDTLLRALMFWAMFIPLGARWSIDALRGRVRRAASPVYLSVATAGITLQIVMVYWFTVILKSSPKWWQQGDALFYILHADLFVTRAGLWLREIDWALRPLTWGSVLWEAIGPALLFVPRWNGVFRTLAVLGFFALHVSIGIFMDVGIFPIVCMAAWLVVLPAWFWDRPAFTAVEAMARPAADRLHRLVDRWSSAPEAPRGVLRSRWPGNVVAGFFLVYILLWNIRTVDFERFRAIFPTDVNVIGRIFRIEQQWNMFAPGPTTNDGWYVIEGETLGGDVVDLLAGGGPVSWEKPELVTETIDGRRWGKFLNRLRLEKYRKYRTYYTRYLGRAWNAEHDGDDRVDIVRFNYMRERTTATGPAEPEKVMLWKKTKLAGGG